MNISPPSSAKRPSSASHPTTPLTTAHILQTDLSPRPSLSTFTTLLTLIETASALLTNLRLILDLYTHPSIAFIQQTARLINDLTNSAGFTTHSERMHYITSIGAAANTLHTALEEEKERYYENMSILLAQASQKMRAEIKKTGGLYFTARRLGKGGLDSAQALKKLVGGGERGKVEYREGYLSEIAKFWRRWGGTGEARLYEEVWTYVSGRVLVQE